MGSFRFHKSFKLLPGVKLNVNKNSLSLTAGVRGAHATINTNGQRTLSAGIPGTGLSYRDTRKIGAAKPTAPVPESFEVWTAQVNDTSLSLRSSGDPAVYDLFVNEDGTWWRVGHYTDNYAAAENALQWETWIRVYGGSVAEWREQQAGGK